MKDRTPQNPGRVLITPENGAAAYYATLTRADNPTQAGDPLNKATLLKDSTAALFEKDANAVPDDILREIWATYRKQIGDTLTTARTDLGEKWLLCNGANAHTDRYPQLRALMPNTALQEMSSTLFGNVYDVKYANGVWVAACGNYIATAPALEGPWSFTSVSGAYAIANDGTKWVVVGYNSTDDKVFVYISTDPASGNWSKKIVSNIDYVYEAIAHDNGTWVTVGYERNHNYGGIYVTQDPAGAWTSKSGFSPRMKDVICANGIWAATGYKYISPTYNPSVSVSTDGGETWTAYQITTDVNIRGARLLYAQGKWILLCDIDDIADSPGACGYIFTADDPTGAWTRIDALANMIGTSLIAMTGFEFTGDTYYAAGYNGSLSALGVHIFSAKSLSGPWSEEVLSPDLHATGGRITAVNGHFFMGCAPKDSSGNYHRNIATDALFPLPAESHDKLYTYIKAKE